jgi:3-hydroxybutyryl-CoA dehydrogenase
VEITRVAVIGLGTMGAGIAQVLLEGGLQVVGRDVEQPFVERARGRIEAGLAKRVEKGRLTQDEAAGALGRLRTTTALADCAEVDLVIEAIVEELEPKQQLLAELGGLCPAHTAFATNTSALSVTRIGAASGRPERVLGLHFFNPAPLMPLVEVVRTPRTIGDVYESSFALMESCGKQAVRCNDTPGFLVNRILIPLMNDCIRALDETGATIEDIDKAMRYGAGWPMGPFTLLDLIGADVHVHAAEALFEATREPRMAAPPRLARMVDAGLLGRKSGRGFYRYDEA